MLRFRGKVYHRRRMKLHPRRQVVSLRARRDIRIDGVAFAEFPVHFLQHPHLALALGGAARFRRVEIGDRRFARL